MDWLTFVAKIIGSFAWPFVIIIFVILFRRTIRKLLLNIRGIKYKDFEMRFERKLDEIESRVKEVFIPLEETEVPMDELETTISDSVEQLALISPRASVTEAWRQIEKAIIESIQYTRKPIPHRSKDLMKSLAKANLLPKEAISLLDEMRILRNEAVHASELDLEPRQAIEYGRLAEQIIKELKSNIEK